MLTYSSPDFSFNTAAPLTNLVLSLDLRNFTMHQTHDTFQHPSSDFSFAGVLRYRPFVRTSRPAARISAVFKIDETLARNTDARRATTSPTSLKKHHPCTDNDAHHHRPRNPVVLDCARSAHLFLTYLPLLQRFLLTESSILYQTA